MPIYEYECLSCGVTFEKRQSFSDEPVADCPNGHAKTRRLIAAPAIVFKGSGFYINDSKSAMNGRTNGTSKKDSDTSDSSKKDTDASESSKAEPAENKQKESKRESKKEDS